MSAKAGPTLKLTPLDSPGARRPPETAEQKAKRITRQTARLAQREHRIKAEIAALTGARPRSRHGSVRPLDAIEDPERRLEVLRARVERLENLFTHLNRKRDTRAKIVLGAALFAEARDTESEDLIETFREILDRRVERPQDRLAIKEAFGIPLEPVRRESALDLHPPLPDFDALLPADPGRTVLRGAAVHPDYAGLRVGADPSSSAAKMPGDDRTPERHPKE